MSLNFYYCKGDGFHAVIEEQNEKCATEYFVYLMNELLEPEKGITIKDVICEQVNLYKYKAAQQSFAADGVVGSPVYGATSHCTVCKKRIVYSEDGWLHCEPQDHGFARPDADIQNPPRR